MNNKAVRHSFKVVLEAAGKLECEDLPHTDKQKHKSDVACPVKYKLDRHIKNVYDYASKEFGAFRIE